MKIISFADWGQTGYLWISDLQIVYCSCNSCFHYKQGVKAQQNSWVKTNNTSLEGVADKWYSWPITFVTFNAQHSSFLFSALQLTMVIVVRLCN